MKKVKKILLIDDDSIANFVNKHLIKWMQISEELCVLDNFQEARQELYCSLENLDSQEQQCEMVILLDAQLKDRNELLPSHVLKKLAVDECNHLLMIVILYDSLNDPSLQFIVKDSIEKPITSEKLKQAWSSL